MRFYILKIYHTLIILIHLLHRLKIIMTQIHIIFHRIISSSIFHLLSSIFKKITFFIYGFTLNMNLFSLISYININLRIFMIKF